MPLALLKFTLSGSTFVAEQSCSRVLEYLGTNILEFLNRSVLEL